MTETYVKYLIFLAIKAERERIAGEINKISISYFQQYVGGDDEANLTKLVSDIAEAVSSSK